MLGELPAYNIFINGMYYVDRTYYVTSPYDNRYTPT